jgi:hypothetical protein
LHGLLSVPITLCFFVSRLATTIFPIIPLTPVTNTVAIAVTPFAAMYRKSHIYLLIITHLQAFEKVFE